MRAVYLALLLFLRCSEHTAGSFFKKDTCDGGGSRPLPTGYPLRRLKPGEVFWANYTREWDQFMDILYVPQSSPLSSDAMACSHWVVVATAGARADDVEAFMASTVSKLAHAPCVAYVTASDIKNGDIRALENKYPSIFKLLDSAYITELGKAIEFVKMMEEHRSNTHALRNIGYIYAMLHGARTITDMQLDVRLPEGASGALLQLPRDSLLTPPPSVQVHRVRHGADHKEPRLDLDIRSLVGRSSSPANVSSSPGGPNPNPTLVEEPVFIDSSSVYVLSPLLDKSLGGRTAVLLPKGLYAAYDAQATVHMWQSFWTLFLPVTVPERESSMVRSFVAERLAQDISGAHVLFAEPFFGRSAARATAAARQDDPSLQSRMHLLTRKLREFRSTTGRCAQSRIEELYALLYELGFVEHRDFACLFYWLRAFFAIKSSFPSLKEHLHSM